MGNRLSKIYTRTGDDGTTGLGDGKRTPKDATRVCAYGTTDELNCTIGMVLACDGIDDDIRDILGHVQQDLFDLGGELCVPGLETIQDSHVAWLEHALDRFNADLPRLREFILPGGNMAAATCQLARTVCRRAERIVVTLAREEGVRPPVCHYLNRLSDLLFVLARVIGRRAGHPEVLWQHEKVRKPRS